MRRVGNSWRWIRRRHPAVQACFWWMVATPALILVAVAPIVAYVVLVLLATISFVLGLLAIPTIVKALLGTIRGILLSLVKPSHTDKVTFVLAFVWGVCIWALLGGAAPRAGLDASYFEMFGLLWGVPFLIVWTVLRTIARALRGPQTYERRA